MMHPQMLVTIIKLAQLLAVVEASEAPLNAAPETGNETTTDRPFISEADILNNILLKKEYIKRPDNKIFKKYIATLENSIRQCKRQFPKDKAVTGVKYDTIDELFVEIFNFPEVISKLKTCAQENKLTSACKKYIGLLTYFGDILEMLTRNNVFPLVNNDSSGGKGKKFLSGLIHGLLLDELSKITTGYPKSFEKNISNIFSLLSETVQLGWAEKFKTVCKETHLELLPTVSKNMDRISSALKNIKDIPKTMYYDRNIISGDVYLTLNALMYSLLSISSLFIEYKNLIASFEKGCQCFIEEYFKKYVDTIGSMILCFIKLAVPPMEQIGFAEAMKPSYLEMIENTEDYSPNPAQEDQPEIKIVIIRI